MPDLQVPLIPVRNLPEHTGALDTSTYVVVVQGNQDTVRVPWDSVIAGFITQASTPSGTVSPGAEGNMAYGVDGIYSYYNGQWGKTPRCLDHWDELDETARFLLVNKVMSLTDEERAILEQNVGVSHATAENFGTVKLSEIVTTDEDGALTVPLAGPTKPGVLCVGGGEGTTGDTSKIAASIQYVDMQLQELRDNPVQYAFATAATPGVIRASSSVRVDAAGIATVPAAVPATTQSTGTPGIVNVAPLQLDMDSEMVISAYRTYVPTLQLVDVIVKDVVEKKDVPLASVTAPGIIIPTGALYITNSLQGTVDVRTADTVTRGAVWLTSSLTSEEASRQGYVPTSQAIKDYLLNNPAAINIPAATQSKIGGIKASPTILVDSDGVGSVPTAGDNRVGVVRITSSTGAASADDVATSTRYVRDYVVEYLTDSYSLPVATESVLGAVNVVTAPRAGVVFGTSFVPTYECMKQYVQQTGWSGGTVTGACTFSSYVTLDSEPVSPNHAVRKSYVDSEIEARQLEIDSLTERVSTLETTVTELMGRVQALENA